MISFSGLDGAGKSTQIAKLSNYFESKRLRHTYFWSRGGYTPGISFFKQLLRKSSSNLVPATAGPSKKRDDAFKNTYIKKLWLTLSMIDLTFYYAIVLRFKKLLGFKIICDRYIIDTEIDFTLNFPDQKVERWWIWRLFKIVSPKPKHHFVLTIPVEESVRRSKLKNEPFPDSPQVLEIRLKKYLEYAHNNKYVHHIDGLRNIEEVANEINSILGL